MTNEPACTHPSRDMIEASLDGALFALCMVDIPTLSSEQLRDVLLNLYCGDCLEAWARQYSGHCIGCAIGEWVQSHARVQAVPVPDDLADAAEAFGEALDKEINGKVQQMRDNIDKGMKN